MSITSVEDKVFLLSTAKTSYAIYLGSDGLPMNAYWGDTVARVEDFADHTFVRDSLHFPPQQLWPEEYAAFGGLRHKETALKVLFADGTHDLRLHLSGVVRQPDTLCLRLQDEHYPLVVELWYRVHEQLDILERWCSLHNSGTEAVTLESCASAQLSLPGTGYHSINFTGRWGGEFQQHSSAITCGKHVYESLYGITGHQCGPFFAVHRGATETAGSVWYGALGYSGNFKVTVEDVCGESLNIVAGISNADLAWELAGNGQFETPHIYLGHACGLGEMSRTLHRFARQQLLPAPWAGRTLPVLYNSWYATEFAVDEAQQLRLARRAAALGVELFVMDDGWFRGRLDSTAGLGDWVADSTKFPDGLSTLIGGVEALGMRFGLWVEPEMVNPNSDLYRQHPDWILRYASREPLQWRNQYMLDLSSKQVQDYLFDALDQLLCDNHITYLKWDMNRYMAEVASALCTRGQEKSLYHGHTQGFYCLAGRLRAAHPYLELESCASGGGRVDYGALRYFDEVWPSDNTDPLDRLLLQQHYTLLYPAKCMRAWITDDSTFNGRQVPLQFAAHTAMCGALGIGVDLSAKDDDTLAALQGYVTQYKAIRELVQLGDCYRLSSLEDTPLQAVQYLLGGRGVLFAFLRSGMYGRQYYTCHLQGLVANQLYCCDVAGTRLVRSGSYLMQHGLPLLLHGDWSSLLVTIEPEA